MTTFMAVVPMVTMVPMIIVVTMMTMVAEVAMVTELAMVTEVTLVPKVTLMAMMPMTAAIARQAKNIAAAGLNLVQACGSHFSAAHAEHGQGQGDSRNRSEKHLAQHVKNSLHVRGCIW